MAHQFVIVFALLICVLPSSVLSAQTVDIAFLPHVKRGNGKFFGGAFYNALDYVNAENNGDVIFRSKYRDTEGSEVLGARQMMNLIFRHNVSAFIGPDGFCRNPAVNAAAFNLPFITYGCHDLWDKMNSTFVSTQPSTTKQAKFILSLMKYFKWTSCTILSGHVPPFRDTSKFFVNQTLSYNIRINNITYHENITFFHPMVNISQYMTLIEATYRTTRVYVFLGDYESLIKFVRAMYKKGLTQTGDYVVITVYDKDEVRSGEEYFHTEQETGIPEYGLEAFRNVLVLMTADNTNKNWKTFKNETLTRSEKPPINLAKKPDFLSERRLPQAAAYLYDAVILYAEAVRKAINDSVDVNNGSYIINAIRGTRYTSIRGLEMHIDDTGENEGNYTVWSIMMNETGLVPNMHAVGTFNSSLHFHPIPGRKINWVSGSVPASQPKCGFDGSLCEDSKPDWQLATICLVVAGVIIVVLVLFVRHYLYEQKLARLLWKIDRSEVRFLDTNDLVLPGRHRRKKSENRWPFLLLRDTDSDAGTDQTQEKESDVTLGSYRDTHVVIKQVTKKNLELSRTLRKQLQLRKELNHDNINRFIGAVIETPQIHILTQYCSRRSLQDIIQNEDSPLDDMFVASLIADLIKGMSFIHDSEFQSHGHLKSSNCLVDSRWVLQISDFGLYTLYYSSNTSVKDENKHFSRLQWKAPEILRDSTLDPKGTQKGDVYSFSLILYHIHDRHGPWGDITDSPKEIVKRVREGAEKGLFRPDTSHLNCLDVVTQCMRDCWAEYPDQRPDFKTIRTRLRPMQQGLKPNIFDNMLAMMEKYANSLEAQVSLRTEQLSLEKKMTENLLLRMLPRSVAEQLKRGKQVVPEQYECVSIYFSDIVGFTEISAQSTPMQVVDLLNDLYICFDSIIESYDVYKVETIGDAYMVVSGLPIRNGDRHAGEVASLSLHLLEAIRNFKIRHKPDATLAIRIGIHSGPCCSGVVGLKMPRYCLFGDTVNTASRMETTGIALKIHCSSECKDILDKLGGYHLEERGYVSMKGKGDRKTFFLMGEDQTQRRQRISTQRNNETRCVSASNLDYCGKLFSFSDTGQRSSQMHRLLGSKYLTPNATDFGRHSSVGPVRQPVAASAACLNCEQDALQEEPMETKCLLNNDQISSDCTKCQMIPANNGVLAVKSSRSCDDVVVYLNGRVTDSVV